MVKIEAITKNQVKKFKKNDEIRLIELVYYLGQIALKDSDIVLLHLTFIVTQIYL